VTTQHSTNTASDARASRASPQPGGRRRPVLRWVVPGVLFVAAAASVFGVLPRLGAM
jgi:hypothetical protein